MIVKTLFLILVGTALVLSNPVTKHHDNHVEVSDPLPENNNHDVQVESNTKRSWSTFVESSKQKSKELLEKLKNKWPVIKEKASLLFKEAQETFKEIKNHGTEAIAEFKEAYKTLSETWDKIKKTSAETYDEAVKLYAQLKEIVEAIKKEWNSSEAAKRKAIKSEIN